MKVYEDVVKMINTVRGTEKMFGYESQLANRLYFIYILAGKFYNDQTIQRRTKLVFIIFSWLAMILDAIIVISYLIYGDKNDFQLLMSIIYSTFIVILVFIVEPLLAVYFYGNDIMKAIEIADRIIMKKINREKLDGEMNVEHLALVIIFVELVVGIAFFIYSPTAMLLFYEEEKTKDYNYYLAYVPNVAEWGSIRYFYVANMTLAMGGFPIYMYSISMMCLVHMFSCICHNEAQRTAHELNSMSCEDIAIVEVYKEKVEPRFRTILTKCVRDYADLIKMLKNFKGYYTTLSSILISALFLIELSHAITIILPGASPIVRVKGILVFIATALPLVVFCWAGDIFTETNKIVSFAVYSLPWYWSTVHRKDVYILLCQTQVSTDQTERSIYSIQLRTILRFLNGIQSTVNVLRAAAFK